MELTRKERPQSASETVRCECAQGTCVLQKRNCSQSKLINALKGYRSLLMCFLAGFLAMKTKSTSQVPGQPENSSNSNTPKPTTASSTEPDADHYEKFFAELKQWEDMWCVNKAANWQRINGAPMNSSILTSTPPSIPPVPVSSASSVGRAPVCCAGGRGFEPQTGLTLRVLK